MQAPNLDGLIGLQFDIEKRNCWSLVRDFYKLNYGIELSDYACPTNWWDDPELDFFRGLWEQEGFKIWEGNHTTWRTGDLLVMAISGNGLGNHFGIVVPGTKILHHLPGRLSEVSLYGGLFRNNTIAVLRHRDVPIDDTTRLVEMKDLLPLHVRRRLENR